jgi:hypothetical protein
MKNFPLSASVSRREFLGSVSVGAALLTLSPPAAGQSSVSRKLGVALCGLGNYARGQLGPALKLTQNCELRGVVTGSPEKGEAPVAVTAGERPKQRPEFFRDVEEAIDWTMEFADGARGDFSTSYNDNLNKFRAERERLDRNQSSPLLCGAPSRYSCGSFESCRAAEPARSADG